MGHRFVARHLDLLAEIEDGPRPTDDSLEVAAATPDGLFHAPRRAWWNLSTYILKATGRGPPPRGEVPSRANSSGLSSLRLTDPNAELGATLPASALSQITQFCAIANSGAAAALPAGHRGRDEDLSHPLEELDRLVTR